MTFDFGEDRVVFAHADILAGPPLRTALTADDVAGDNQLATVLRDEPPAFLCAIGCSPYSSSSFLTWTMIDGRSTLTRPSSCVSIYAST